MAVITTGESFFYRLLTESCYRVLRHAVFLLSLLLISLNTTVVPGDSQEIYSGWEFYFYLLLVWGSYIGMGYFNLYYLIPSFLFRGKYLYYFLYACLSVLIGVIFLFVLEFYFFYFLEQPLERLSVCRSGIILFLDVGATFFLYLIVLTGGGITILLARWIRENERAGKLEKENIRTELESLKEKVNPDFLFTILGRIRDLEKKDTLRTTETLMAFSRLLRYQLYDCNYEYVFLHAEIRFLTNYLNLEKLYYKNLEFSITTEREMQAVLIPPLLFIPFLYSAVNTLEIPDDFLKIELYFKGNEKEICFSYSGNVRMNMDSPPMKTLKKRLGIQFGSSYLLWQEITESNGEEIYLQLNLYNG